METQLIDRTSPAHPNRELILLSEQHLGEWFQLMDDLQDAHAPTDQLVYCRKQIMWLQHNLYHLRNA